ncbi:MAG: hypothetical protein ACOYNL_09900 [Rickettsiales bacterium]
MTTKVNIPQPTITGSKPVPPAMGATPSALTDSEGHNLDKRKHTYGERKFNWITYGGFALLGNEAASLIITKAAEDENKNPRGLYKPFKEFFAKFEDKKFMPKYVWDGGLAKVLIALVGGMLMVPFVKNMEDNKGEKVRAYNRKHYGNRIDTDPDFIEAHKEMDEAPKQTWGSLWKGRLVTVFAAIGVDGLVGAVDAPSTRLFKPGSTLAKYSSMDRIASEVSEKTLKLFNTTKEASPKAHGWLQRGSWLLVLSSTLTALFYVSSKLFAKKRVEKIERRMQHNLDSTQQDEAPATDDQLAQAKPNFTERPEAKISTVSHENRVTPQLLPSAQVGQTPQ